MTGQRYSGSKQPPEHGEPRTDPWGWLYREDGPVEPVRPPAPVQRDHAYGYDLPAGPPGPPGQHPSSPAYPTAPPSYPTPASAPSQDFPLEENYPDYPGTPADPDRPATPTGAEPPAGRRGRGLMTGLIIGSLVLVLALAAILVYLTRIEPGRSDDPAGQPSGQTSPSGSGGSERPSESSESATSDGAAVEPITPTGAKAECVAADATDGNGDPVTYAAANLVDGDLDSAWRCDGDGVDETVRISLPSGSTVAEVGLVNGYAKVDPGDETRRYPEYRRITRVRWEFSTGETVEQDLQDKTEAMQTVDVPVQQDVDWVEVTILASTAPGSDASTRDAVLISEVRAASPT